MRLEDGTIDFDVQLTDRRSFVYLYFRAESDGEREEIYLRQHKSNLPDAVQYAPVWQGRSAWQLYHGPGGTAAVGFDPGAWTHVRLVVQDRSAAVFIGDMTMPAMVVPRLAREPRAGYIALGGFLPRDVPGSGPIARFSNVVVTPGHVPYDFAPARTEAVPAAEAGTYAFDLGLSDIATVFVNGAPVFRGNASYSFDRPRREGLIGFDETRLYLPLGAGDNELAIVVSDSFGGWGLMGRFVDGAGLTVSAR